MGINRYVYMQINTLRAHVIHEEKYQPRMKVCLIPDQTCKTIAKETALWFIQTWSSYDMHANPHVVRYICFPTSCFTLIKRNVSSLA